MLIIGQYAAYKLDIVAAQCIIYVDPERTICFSSYMRVPVGNKTGNVATACSFMLNKLMMMIAQSMSELHERTTLKLVVEDVLVVPQGRRRLMGTMQITEVVTVDDDAVAGES